MQIYGPYETVRDYITADDAAAAMIAASRDDADKARVLVKIVAAEQSATIVEIVSTFNRVARRTPCIVTSAIRHFHLYSRRASSFNRSPCRGSQRSPDITGQRYFSVHGGKAAWVLGRQREQCCAII